MISIVAEIELGGGMDRHSTEVVGQEESALRLSGTCGPKVRG